MTSPHPGYYHHYMAMRTSASVLRTALVITRSWYEQNYHWSAFIVARVLAPKHAAPTLFVPGHTTENASPHPHYKSGLKKPQQRL